MVRSATDLPSRRTESHLFTVRLWAEQLAAGRVEWRGRVTHVLSGETRYFREWTALVEFMNAVLVDLGPDHPVTAQPRMAHIETNLHTHDPCNEGT